MSGTPSSTSAREIAASASETSLWCEAAQTALYAAADAIDAYAAIASDLIEMLDNAGMDALARDRRKAMAAVGGGGQ